MKAYINEKKRWKSPSCAVQNNDFTNPKLWHENVIRNDSEEAKKRRPCISSNLEDQNDKLFVCLITLDEENTIVTQEKTSNPPSYEPRKESNKINAIFTDVQYVVQTNIDES